MKTFENYISDIFFKNPKIKEVLKNFLLTVKEERGDYNIVLNILYNFSLTGKVSKEEVDFVKKKLMDFIKYSTGGAIWMIPGGMFLLIGLIIIAKKFNVDLLPSRINYTLSKD